MQSNTAILICLALNLSVMGAPALASDKEADAACGKKVAALGRPSPIQSIASMNSVQLWIELAQERNGTENATWHNAHGALIKCEQVKQSDMYRCYATGKPCPPTLETDAPPKAK